MYQNVTLKEKGKGKRFSYYKMICIQYENLIGIFLWEDKDKQEQNKGTKRGVREDKHKQYIMEIPIKFTPFVLIKKYLNAFLKN